MVAWSRGNSTTSRAFGGFAGLALFFAAAGTVGWNEVRTVKQAAANAEFQRSVKTVSATVADSANEAHAIHLNGELKTEAGVRDDDFGVGNEDVVVLQREVEMYQWESYKKDDKTHYRKVWDDTHHQLSGQYANPPMPRIGAQTLVAPDARIGVFDLKSADLKSLDRKAIVPAELNDKLATEGWQVRDNQIYRSQNPSQSPEIGDVRVSFTALRETPVSVIGSQHGSRLTPYIANNGYDVFIVNRGTQDLPSMIQETVSSNNFTAWGLRLGGIAAMAVGLGTLFSGWLSIFSWIPLFGPLVQRAAFGVGVALGGTLGILLFSAAWLYAHPLIAAITIIAVIGLTLALARRTRRGNSEPVGIHSPPPPPPPRAA